MGRSFKRFNRRKEGSTYDPAEVEAWKGELKYITPGQYAQSEYTADQMRKETPNRVKSPHARKFAREVNRIHHDDSRNPVDVFTLAKAISYKGDGESLFKGTIQMHYDSAVHVGVGATDWRDGSTASVLRATADAQAAENGDATDEVPAMSFKSLRYIKGLLFRMIKNLGASPGQAVPALTFCIPADSSSTDDTGAKWSRTINRKEGNYVVASAAANGLAYLPIKKGNAFELHRLQHFTSPATEPPVSLPGGRRLCSGEPRRRHHAHGGRFRVRGLRRRTRTGARRLADTPAHQAHRLPSSSRRTPIR
jgi:hypothetical protein